MGDVSDPLVILNIICRFLSLALFIVAATSIWVFYRDRQKLAHQDRVLADIAAEPLLQVDLVDILQWPLWICGYWWPQMVGYEKKHSAPSRIFCFFNAAALVFISEEAQRRSNVPATQWILNIVALAIYFIVLPYLWNSHDRLASLFYLVVPHTDARDFGRMRSQMRISAVLIVITSCILGGISVGIAGSNLDVWVQVLGIFIYVPVYASILLPSCLMSQLGVVLFLHANFLTYELFSLAARQCTKGLHSYRDVIAYLLTLQRTVQQASKVCGAPVLIPVLLTAYFMLQAMLLVADGGGSQSSAALSFFIVFASGGIFCAGMVLLMILPAARYATQIQNFYTLVSNILVVGASFEEDSRELFVAVYHQGIGTELDMQWQQLGLMSRGMDRRQSMRKLSALTGRSAQSLMTPLVGQELFPDPTPRVSVARAAGFADGGHDLEQLGLGENLLAGSDRQAMADALAAGAQDSKPLRVFGISVTTANVGQAAGLVLSFFLFVGQYILLKG